MSYAPIGVRLFLAEDTTFNVVRYGTVALANSTDEHQALRLQYVTIGWNGGEVLLTIGLGIAAGSLALIGFGCDSLIEIFTSLVVIWHVRLPAEQQGRVGKQRALRLVAGAFLLLALVLAAAASHDLMSGRRAEASLIGIIYLGFTAVVMFSLAAAKHRLALRMDSAPLKAEATMTMLDGILSIATLVGLGLNAVLGWWWADPGAALLVAIAALNEARDLWAESRHSNGTISAQEKVVGER